MKQIHEQLGLAAYVCARAGAQRSVDNLVRWVAPAVQHRQIKFAFDRMGFPIGYWTWAMLAPDVSRRLSDRPNAPLHESEWNEGGLPWVMELASCGGHLVDMVRFIRQSSPSGSGPWILRRTREGGRPARARAWRALSPEAYDEWASSSQEFRLPRSCYAGSYLSGRPILAARQTLSEHPQPM